MTLEELRLQIDELDEWQTQVKEKPIIHDEPKRHHDEHKDRMNHFKNAEIALKNQQASIQGLETQIGQLAKLISKRPQGSLPSNTQSNPREQLNEITIQDDEGLVVPKPVLRQEAVVSKGKGEVDHNDQKPVSKEYKPRVPYPNATRKDRTDEQFGSKSIHKPSNNKEPIHEEQMLQIEELDEWRTNKPRTHDKPKPRHDELNVEPNQLKVGEKVLLDVADPRIATSEPNEAIPLTVLSIFPYGMRSVNSSHHHDHAPERFFNPHGMAHGRALGRAHTTRGDTAV
ncbi:hypothetical protein GOBAR_AA16813 [Gossypium barbadense]|uniref:Uncharacterized protein n=1 Tax=Gossypium barbadense TaxID=3634 RepID=A0A2P5XKI1_GOSBA|nr:hypothetical protein GOBAR_AA16813 [Gossypium barbadense]